ncbi:uncharacterized protein LOC129763544 [Toxorhynchites rutilus septentrionalis]|uniref:uncharacterized protein LOC129763544 n=1 Tax=Toxorhynchites rutilus septentrionalis TaxID=329112 RepID=UPI002479347D|nr:uncharacterized protein LOC129763544 [Toxorhynchites rutilus septentrionalis]
MQREKLQMSSVNITSGRIAKIDFKKSLIPSPISLRPSSATFPKQRTDPTLKQPIGTFSPKASNREAGRLSLHEKSKIPTIQHKDSSFHRKAENTRPASASRFPLRSTWIQNTSFDQQLRPPFTGTRPGVIPKIVPAAKPTPTAPTRPIKTPPFDFPVVPDPQIISVEPQSKLPLPQTTLGESVIPTPDGDAVDVGLGTNKQKVDAPSKRAESLLQTSSSHLSFFTSCCATFSGFIGLIQTTEPPRSILLIALRKIRSVTMPSM